MHALATKDYEHGLIIAADDDLTMAVMVETLAKSAGFRAKVYNDGHYVLEALEHFHPSLIVLDVRMREMDGFEVCKKIRKQQGLDKFSMPILLITVNDNLSSLEQAQAVGATDIMPKPLNWNLFKGLMKCMAVHHSDANRIIGDSISSIRETIILEQNNLQIAHAGLNLCLNQRSPGSELRHKNIIDLVVEEDHHKLLSEIDALSAMDSEPRHFDITMQRDDKSEYQSRMVLFGGIEELPGMVVAIGMPID